MSYYLWQLLRDAYTQLGQLQVAEATGGSTTTVVDSTLIGTGRDDDWNGGAVIILSADGESPEGEFGRVTDYVDSTGTLTVPEMSAAVAAGDRYGLVSEYYPLHQMIELANQALQSLGDLTLVEKVLVWQVSRLDGQNEFMVERLREARVAVESLRRLHPIWQVGRVGRGMEIGD